MNLDRQFIKFYNRHISPKWGGEGLVIGISLICMGMFSILGPLQLAIQNEASFLLVNALFAFLLTLTLVSSYDLILSLVAPILVVVELMGYVFSLQLDVLMTPIISNKMELAGEILALFSGLNILQITKIPVLNLLPTLFVPLGQIFFS